jgi:D-arabinose 1-dehydrogenase-like Zn-dependent alcohol dehydrogenase
MKPGRILGHEGVGVVESIGPRAPNVAVGDRADAGRHRRL